MTLMKFTLANRKISKRLTLNMVCPRTMEDVNDVYSIGKVHNDVYSSTEEEHGEVHLRIKNLHDASSTLGRSR